eukprot:NODE_4440_length_801_cov_10.914894_g3684_i0.p6 GENE.NODE_4440_length_801_cov_10.914894_g3684_i0~~NODE_4440_length_801_cov_10.914894_g3684_i0.p6  ORF type:complete len:50 (+),score=7.72 NODE_4440_length_801_cov_10.914894_g3684_i0:496-645(+)
MTEGSDPPSPSPGSQAQGPRPAEPGQSWVPGPGPQARLSWRTLGVLLQP